jgi:hypothetical protein
MQWERLQLHQEAAEATVLARMSMSVMLVACCSGKHFSGVDQKACKDD